MQAVFPRIGNLNNVLEALNEDRECEVEVQATIIGDVEAWLRCSGRVMTSTVPLALAVDHDERFTSQLRTQVGVSGAEPLRTV